MNLMEDSNLTAIVTTTIKMNSPPSTCCGKNKKNPIIIAKVKMSASGTELQINTLCPIPHATTERKPIKIHSAQLASVMEIFNFYNLAEDSLFCIHP